MSSTNSRRPARTRVAPVILLAFLAMITLLTSTGPVAQAATGRSLLVSRTADRSAAQSLAGSTASGPVWIFVPHDASISRIDFSIPSIGYQHRERYAPWELAGGRAFDTRSLPNGTHIVRAHIRHKKGVTSTTSATFQVSNATEPSVPTTAPKATATSVPSTSAPTSTTSSPTSTITTPGPQPVGVGGSLRLVFSDEFAGTSLDLSKWRPNWLAGSDHAITKPINSAELSCYDPAQVSVGGGHLRLAAARRSCTDNTGRSYNYASGLVQSYSKGGQWQYGVYEARVYLPGTASGHIYNWPAFWLNGVPSVPWPVGGEIDVMEGLEGSAGWTYHKGTSADADTQKSPTTHPAGNFVGWHTFTTEWSPGSLTFYYDGVKVGSWASNVTTTPQYLILNYGVGGWGGDLNVPQTMLVDYVRVWQRS